MQKLQDQVAALTRENEALQAENQGLKAKLDSTDSVPVLLMGDEFEFYPGEIKDLLLGGKIDTEGRYEKKWGSRDQQRR